MARRTLKLPDAIHTALGNVPVTLTEGLVDSKEALGLSHFVQRGIEVDASLDPATRWATFWHEVIHFALLDAGTNNTLTEPQVESICDAVGTFLGSMTLTGTLKITTPKT